MDPRAIMSSAKAAGDAPYGQAATGGSLVPLRRLRAYKDTVARLFPALPRVCIDTWSILDHDALVIRHFLEALQHKVAVLEVGTFVGVSAYHFACQPNVTRVITVDPNPYIWDEVNDKVATIGIIVDTKQLRDLRVLDVAQAALDALHGERAKIEIKVGVLSTHSAPALSSALKVAEVSVPEPNSLDGARLVAFLDGLHSKEAVHGDLEAIFRGNPDAWVILDDCRYRWG